MVGKTEGKIDKISKESRTMRLTIPAELASDTSFPFEPGDKVTIEIEKNGLRVRKEE